MMGRCYQGMFLFAKGEHGSLPNIPQIYLYRSNDAPARGELTNAYGGLT